MRCPNGERALYVCGTAVVAASDPGDMTPYEFLWMPASPGFVLVAGLPDFRMYEYSIESIKQCYEDNRALVGTHQFPSGDPCIGYVTGHSGHCNQWTAWAMVQCLAEWWMRD